MISVVQNTLESLNSDLLVKLDQMILKLDIDGKFNGKTLGLILLITKLLNDDNISDEDKIKLNYKLLNLKNIKIY